MFSGLIILAFALRFILMPISAHSDLFFINSFPNLLVTQNVFDIYSYIKENISDARFSYYPPLTYYTFAFFQLIYQFFSSSFSSWMVNLVDLYLSSFNGQAADFIKAAANPHIFRDLFLGKSPYLLFDFAAFLVLINFVKRRLIKKAAIFIWLFNPVSLYAIYMMGQFEIIPAFLVLLGFFVLRKNPSLGILTLGIAAAFKNYAFLFILPTILIYGHTWREKAKLLVISFAPYFLFLIPTLITSPKDAIFALLPKVYLIYRKPLEGWALYSQYIKYSLLIASYIIILIMSSVIKIKDKWKLTLGLSLASVLFVYALAPRISFHYLLWAAPLVILWFRNVKVAAMIVIIQAISLASYKLLANHLQTGLFAPLNYDLFSRMPTLNSLIDQVIPYRIISTIGFLVFFFLNLYFAVRTLLQLMFQEEVKLCRR